MAIQAKISRPRDRGIRKESFRHPIEFLFEEHDRQRVVCAALELLANDHSSDDAHEHAELVLNYLEHDLPLHIADEEEDLFPLLERRCHPDDNLDDPLALLNEEHETDRAFCVRLLEPLRAIATGLEPTDPVSFAHEAKAFAIFQRRHLGWENGTVLPLARKRLTAEDQAEIGRKMAARRGLDTPP